MKTLIAIGLVAFFCIHEISAIDYDVPISIGRTTPPYMPPPKNPQDCKSLFDNGDYESALQCYSNTTIITPNDAEAWNYKGSALFQMDRLDEALQCFERAIVLQSSHVGAWNNKGLILADQGKYEEAIKCYDVAIQINSENMQTWRAKARALDALGRYEDALQCCNIALNLDPTNGETIYFRNQLLEKLSVSETSLQSEVPINSVDEETVMKNDIISYMVQTVSNNLDDYTISDVQCNVNENNTVLLELELSKKQWYMERRNNVSINETMEKNAPLAVQTAILAYINVVLYYPIVEDLVINTNINKTFTCPRNRVSGSIDHLKLAKQIAYKS